MARINDKKQRQIDKKQKHKDGLLASKRKKRQAESILNRPKPQKNIRKKYLLVCEGNNTEPSYFEQFKCTNIDIKVIGTGYNTKRLVDEAIRLYDESRKKYDNVWCIFDRDNHLHFDEAIYRLKKKRKFEGIWSNEAFEYWLILHFEDHQGGDMSRKEYGPKLNRYLKEFGIKYNYKKNKEITLTFFDVLMSYNEKTKKRRVIEAIKRAKRIYNNKKGIQPSRTASCTTVFRIVERLVNSK